MKYTVDSNNKVVKIESCKKATNNAKAVCLTGVDSSKYTNNKDIIKFTSKNTFKAINTGEAEIYCKLLNTKSNVIKASGSTCINIRSRSLRP